MTSAIMPGLHVPSSRHARSQIERYIARKTSLGGRTARPKISEIFGRAARALKESQNHSKSVQKTFG